MRFLAAAAVVLAWSPGSALAWKIGDAVIKPSFSAGARFDDNITAVNTNKVSDAIAALTAGLNLTLEAKEKRLNSALAVTRETYASETAFNNTSVNFNLGYSQDLTKRSGFGVRESFIRAETPQTFQDQFGSTNGRYTYTTNRLGLSYTKEVSSQVTMKAGYNNEVYRRLTGGGSDSMENAVSGLVEYAVASSTILLGRAGVSRRSYKPGSNVDSQTVDAGVRQYFTKQIYLETFAGFSRINSGGSQLDPRYTLSLTDEFDATTSAVLTFNNSTSANSYDNNVFSSWRLSLDLIRRLYQRLLLTAGVFYGDGSYSAANIDDKLSGVKTRVDYELTPNTSVFLGHTYSSTKSNQTYRTYSRNLLQFGLSVKF